MNKKLIAVAIAGVFASPAAFAQSSVTISGYLKAGIDQFKVTQISAARSAAGTNTSESRITDHSSRILFNVVEDLGGGMQAIGQMDLRITMDAQFRNTNQALVNGATQASNYPLAGGNNHVGLRSSQWGQIKFGRQDTHYGNGGDLTPAKAGHLGAWNASVFDTVLKPGGANTAIANITRTPNLVWYDSPKWGGFTFMVGYSTQPTANSKLPENENDLSTNNRKGRGWTFNPVYNGGNWELAWSHWDAKSDNSGCSAAQAAAGSGACNGITDDQKGDSVRGHYIFPMGLRLGLAYNKSKLTGAPGTGTGAVNAFAGRTTADRTAWALPISYNTGAHTFYLTYTKANSSKDVSNNAGTVFSGSGTGAKLWAATYNYDLSKRTSVGLTYAKLTNNTPTQAGTGAYNMFYVGDSAFGGTNSTNAAHEGNSLFGATVRHNF